MQEKEGRGLDLSQGLVVTPLISSGSQNAAAPLNLSDDGVVSFNSVVELQDSLVI